MKLFAIVLEWQDCKVTVDFFFFQEQFQVPEFLAELGTVVLFRYGSSVLRPSIFFMSQKSYSCFRNDKQLLPPRTLLKRFWYFNYILNYFPNLSSWKGILWNEKFFLPVMIWFFYILFMLILKMLCWRDSNAPKSS